MDQLKSSDTASRVLIEVNRIVAPDDTDILAMYFESRRQSDGGEISSLNECIAKYKHKLPILTTHLDIVYTNLDTAKRVLKRRFFSFHNYLLRASENGYQNDVYPLNKRKLIIRNVHIDLEEENASGSITTTSNHLIIKLYAEHLSPDNDILDMSQSKIFAHTFIVTYANDIDKEMVLTRYNKKSTLRKQQVDLIDCHRLNTCIIRGKNDKEDGVKLKLNELIKCKHFIETIRPLEMSDEFLLIVQFDLSFDDEENECENIFETIQSFCSSNNILVEMCHNFELFKLDKCLRDNETKVSMTKSPQLVLTLLNLDKFVDKAVQTDLTMTSLKEILPSESKANSICSSTSISNDGSSDDKRKISGCSSSDSTVDENDSSKENVNNALVKGSLAQKNLEASKISSSNSSKEPFNCLFYFENKNNKFRLKL